MKSKCLVLAIVGIVAILGAYGVRSTQSHETAINALETSFGARNSEIAVRDYLDKLAKYENCPLEGIIDVNGLSSRGSFCFQKSTYLHFVKRYEIYPYAEEQELLSNWGDSETQEKIIEAMIKENPQMLKKHFYTSVVKRGLGLPNL